MYAPSQISMSESFIKTADILIHSQSIHFHTQKISLSSYYPSGEPISPYRLHCSPFAVVYYSFMGYFFVAAAILARE
jgi:hypothetical protein